MNNENLQQKEQEISIQDIIKIIKKDWKRISIITFSTFVLGFIYLLVSTPIYQVDALLKIESDSGSNFQLLGEASDIFGKDVSVMAEVELLKSRMILEKVVDSLDLDLNIKAHYFPMFGKAIARRTEQLKTLNVTIFDSPIGQYTVNFKDLKNFEVSDKDDVVVLKGEVGKLLKSKYDGNKYSIFIEGYENVKPNDEFTISKFSKLNAIARIQNSLSAMEKGKYTDILSLSYKATNPHDATKILNTIISFYEDQSIKRKQKELSRSLDFLENQLPELLEKTDEAEKKLNNFFVDNGIIDPGQETSLALKIGGDIDEKIMELKQKKEQMHTLYKDSHPNVIALQAQLKKLTNLKAHVERKSKQHPELQRKLLSLSRDLQITTELYTDLLKRIQQIEVLKAGTFGNVEIIDLAQPVFIPIKPKKAIVLAISLLLGLFISLGISLIDKILNQGVEDPSIVEKKLGLNIYATIPESKKQKALDLNAANKVEGTHLLTDFDTNDLVTESFRSLRTAFYFGVINSRNNVTVLTGPSPGIGKSFVSSNFANILAQGDKKVLLIDGDMRRGRIHECLGVKRENGLSEILSGQKEYNECWHHNILENLDFISTGAIPPNPAELLLRDEFKQLIEYANKNYDFVLIDAPPILAVTDAAIIGKLAANTLMILRHGKHSLSEIELCHKRLELSNANVSGIIFNRVQINSGFKYNNYGGDFYYQYEYKSKNG